MCLDICSPTMWLTWFAVVFSEGSFRGVHLKAMVAVLLVFSVLPGVLQSLFYQMACLSEHFSERDSTIHCLNIQEHILPKHGDGMMKGHFPLPTGNTTREDEGEDEVTLISPPLFLTGILLTQALFFLFPLLVRKSWENVFTGWLVKELCEIPIEENMSARKNFDLISIAKRLRNQSSYGLRIYLFEWFNLLNVVGQIFIFFCFIGCKMLPDGMTFVDSIKMLSPEYPYSKVFPLFTKCPIPLTLQNGSSEISFAICTHPFNYINKQIVQILLIWYACLAVYSVIFLIVNTVVFMFPGVRLAILKTRAQVKKSDEAMVKKLNFGLWYRVNQAGLRVPGKVFNEFIKQLSDVLRVESFQDQC